MEPINTTTGEDSASTADATPEDEDAYDDDFDQPQDQEMIPDNDIVETADVPDHFSPKSEIENSRTAVAEATSARNGDSAMPPKVSSTSTLSESSTIFGDGYRIVDGFLFSVETLQRRNVLAACPRLTSQMIDDAWRPAVVELEFGEPEKRPLPDYYYVSMKGCTKFVSTNSIDRKQK